MVAQEPTLASTEKPVTGCATAGVRPAREAIGCSIARDHVREHEVQVRNGGVGDQPIGVLPHGTPSHHDYEVGGGIDVRYYNPA